MKFKPDRQVPAAQIFKQGGQFAPYTGSDRLDDLHKRYGVQAVASFLAGLDRSSKSPASRLDRGATDWAARLAAVRQRFPRRARRAPSEERGADLSSIYLLDVPAETDIEQMAAEYAAEPGVEYAEPNYNYGLFFTPNDPFFSSAGSWGQRFPDLWGLHNIQADLAWDLSTGSGALVAIIDTGLEFHPDIAANVWTNTGEIPNNGVDDDGNGYVDDVHGWDFANGNAEMTDHIGHGTHVAGIAAAVGNNNGGTLGVAWQAQVMPLGVFGDLGSAFSTDIAAALVYAVENGADVVNMSFGGPGDSHLIRDAVDYAAANGLVLVAAAGNSSADVKAFSPASLDPVIAVAAVDHADQPASFSNFGGKVDLAAPGGGDPRPPRYKPEDSVLSLAGALTCPGACVFDPKLMITAAVGPVPVAQFIRLGGTSMAAPHVSGTAALILSRRPEFTPEQVRQALRESADDLGPPGRDARYGYGRLNAARAVARDRVAVARLQTPAHLSRFHGEQITVTGTVKNPGGPAPTWQVSFGPQGQTLNLTATGSGEVSGAELAQIDTAVLARGDYVLRLDVMAADGATAVDTVTFTRLADRPYVRQISDQGGVVSLLPDAWSDDGRTVVWTEGGPPGSNRVTAADLSSTAIRSLARFRWGGELPPTNVFDAAMSADGRSVAFAAPANVDPSNPSQPDPTFQLFLLDPVTNVLQQLTGGTGDGLLGAFTFTPDGSRLGFLSTRALDPSVTEGTPGLYYWDWPTGLIHLIASPGNSAQLWSPQITADGGTIAFVATADLDPSVGNPDGSYQVFLFDVASSHIRQLTRLSGQNGVGLASPQVAIRRDGTAVASWIDLAATTTSPARRTLSLIDVASGSTTDLAEAPTPGGGLPSSVQFTPNGEQLYALTATAPDLLFPPFDGSLLPAAMLFRYQLQTGELRRVLGVNGTFAAGPTGRVATATQLGSVGLDPEGSNSDASPEIYLLDPDTGGGFLWLKRGYLRPRLNGIGRFFVRGVFIQPAALPLDPVNNDVSVTLLSANGQLFRSTLPAGTMWRVRNGWAFSDRQRDDLNQLLITTDDGIHYHFSTHGRKAGLMVGATPYLVAELQIGPAIFSNASRFRTKGRKLTYP